MFNRFFHRTSEEDEEVDADLYLVRPQPNCPNGHVIMRLLEGTQGNKPNCELCLKPTKEKEIYRCHECLWHACKPCFSKLLRWNYLGLGGGDFCDQTFPRCPSKHWLVNYRMTKSSKICNECRNNIMKGESYYACDCEGNSTCDCYKLCLQCHDIKLMEAGALWSDMGHELQQVRCDFHSFSRMVISRYIRGTRCGKCYRAFVGRDTIVACSLSNCRYFLCVECFRPSDSNEQNEPDQSSLEDDYYYDDDATLENIREEEGQDDEVPASRRNVPNEDGNEEEGASLPSVRNEGGFDVEQVEEEEEEDDFPEFLARDLVPNEEESDEDDESRRNENVNEGSPPMNYNHELNVADLDLNDALDIFIQLEEAETGRIATTIPMNQSNGDATISTSNDVVTLSSNNDDAAVSETDRIIEMQNRILTNARNAFLRHPNPNHQSSLGGSIAPPSHPPPPRPALGNNTYPIPPPSHPPPSFSSSVTSNRVTTYSPSTLNSSRPSSSSMTTSTTRHVTFSTTSSAASNRGNGQTGLINDSSATSSSLSADSVSSVKTKDEDLIEVDESTPAILECTICSTYVKNRVLGCGHTLCSSCVNTLKTSINKCPFCNRTIQSAIPFYM